MSGFFYFLPCGEDQFPTQTDGPITSGLLERFGLGHLRDCEMWGRDLVPSRVHANGPNGGGGVCLYARPAQSIGDEAITQYMPQKQTWRKGIGGEFWIGATNDDPPSPQDLARRSGVTGLSLTDQSGRYWVIPVARMPEREFGFLPTSFTFDSGGKAIAKVRGDCERLWQIAGQFFSLWTNDEIDSLPDEEAIDLLIEIMATNYRAGKSEINLLTEMTGDVIDSEFMIVSTKAVCGFFAFEGGKKKEKTTEKTAANRSSS